MNVSPNNRTAQPQAPASGRAAAPNRPSATQGVRQAPRATAPSTSVGAKASAAPDAAAQPTRAEVASSLQRLDAYAESLNERLRGAASDAPAGEASAFRDVADFLQHGLDRIRAGIADGTLAPEDIQRGTKVMFERTRQMLDKARQGEPSGGSGSDAAVKASDGSDAVTKAPARTDAEIKAPAVTDAETKVPAGSDAEVKASAGFDAARADAGQVDAAAARDASRGADAATSDAHADEALADLGRSILARLENLPSELLSLIDPKAMSDRAGRLYGPLDGAEAIAPKRSGVDLAG